MHYKIFKSVKSGKNKYYIQYQNEDGAWEFIQELGSIGCLAHLQRKYFDTLRAAKSYMVDFIKQIEASNTPDEVIYEEVGEEGISG